jgi:hypothetical protein
MACIDTIVTLGICPDEEPSKSGFTLLQAPGISVKNLAATATETYGSGTQLALAKKELAITQVKNDFIGALQANKVVTMLSHPDYNTSVFKPESDMGTYAGFRGLTMHIAKMRNRGRIKKTYIREIQLYPLASGDTTLRIHDGYNQIDYPITVVANQVNVFNKEQLSGFPYELQNDHVVISVDNTNINFAKSEILCGTGCNGGLPNPCAWSDGWNGAAPIKKEGYGINVVFYCDCDYTQIMCDLSNTFIGELIWLKWQIAIFEEQVLSNRFSEWVVYGAEDIRENVLPSLMSKYNAKWNDMMQGLYGILQTYRDDCLQCRGIRWVTNV